MYDVTVVVCQFVFRKSTAAVKRSNKEIGFGLQTALFTYEYHRYNVPPNEKKLRAIIIIHAPSAKKASKVVQLQEAICFILSFRCISYVLSFDSFFPLSNFIHFSVPPFVSFFYSSV